MWLSVAQLAGQLDISERAVRKALEGGRYSVVRQIEGQRARGGKAWEISAYDPAIPISVRQALGLEEKASDKIAKTLEEAARVSIGQEFFGDDKMNQRLRVLRLAQNKPDGVMMRDWLDKISSDEGVSTKTIYRWLKEAERGKVASDRAAVPVALKAESGAIRVEIKSRSIAPSALEYGFSLLMSNPMMDIKRAYEEIAIEAAKRGWEIGSRNSFYRAVAQLPEVVNILARSGKRGAEAIIKPPVRRDMTNVNVYDILIGDQHIFDYIVLDDDGEPIRPQMYAWVDAKSRFFSGIWPVLGDYDQYAVGFSLREACRYGLPMTLYNDWGKPENSKYIDLLRRQLSGKTAFYSSYEDIEHILPQMNAKPRNAQAKAIESYFWHTFERPLSQLNLPGYARRNVDEKRNDFIQESLRREIKGKKLLHFRAFFEIVAQVLDQWHGHMMTEDRSIPVDVFDAGIRRLTRFDDAILDFICWPAAKRMVRNSTIQMTLPGFGKCEWHAPELSALCRRGKTTKVEVRWNPYDSSRIYVLDLETQKQICIAERWGAVDPFDKSEVATKIRRQNQLLKDWVDIGRQLAKPETKVHKFTPYAEAAAEILSIEAQREEIVVDRAEVNRKITQIADYLEREARLAKEG